MKSQSETSNQVGAPTLKNVISYRVIYGDTDQMGVVYYANYLRWFERGRGELLRQIGLPYSTIEAQGFHFPVTEVSCRYSQSAHYDDLIRIETELATLGRATLVFTYRVSREKDSTLLATGATQHACMDSTGRVSRIPKAWAHPLQRAHSKTTGSGGN